MNVLSFLLLATLAMAISRPAIPNNLPCAVPFALTAENLAVVEGIANGTVDYSTFLGSSDLFTHASQGGPIAWPRDNLNKAVIKYCYFDNGDRDKLDEEFRTGLNTWFDRLGGPASRATGHALDFQETVDASHNPIFCVDANHQWTSGLDYNTLVVSYGPDFQPMATYGFVQSNPPRPFSMAIRIPLHFSDDDIVHGLGHVLGLAHEHQRPDRDDHVFYRCSAVTGFDDALARLKARKADATPDDLCNNIFWAWASDFVGIDFVKTDSIGDSRPDPKHDDGRQLFWGIDSYDEPYDLDSIMHYASWTRADGSKKPACDPSYMSNCPLVAYGPDKQAWNSNYMFGTAAPSDKDIEWVKKNYPWRDPPSKA